MDVNVGSDLRDFCMESEHGNQFEGMRGSPQTAIKMHEMRLGHITGQQLGELMGKGERFRRLSCYIGPLFSDMECTLQEKGLGSKGDGVASMRSP
jgi:hypothetical protein